MVDLAAPDLGSIVLQGTTVRVQATVATVASGAASVESIVLVHETPDGAATRKSLDGPRVLEGGTRAVHEAFVRFAYPGCNRLYVETVVATAQLRSNVIATDVEAASYVDGSVEVAVAPTGVVLYGLGVHRSAGGGESRLVARMSLLAPQLPPILGAMSDGLPAFSAAASGRLRNATLPSGLVPLLFPAGADIVWLEDSTVVAGSLVEAVAPSSLVLRSPPTALLGVQLSADRALDALVLSGNEDEPQWLSLCTFAPPGQPEPRGKVLWEAKIPVDLGRAVTGIATLASPSGVVLLARGADGTRLAYASFGHNAPADDWSRHDLAGAALTPDAPPALARDDQGALVGALVHLRDGRAGAPSDWNLVTWRPAVDSVSFEAASLPSSPTAARLAFVHRGSRAAKATPTLVAAVLGVDGAVRIFADNRMVLGGSWHDREPLRLVARGEGVYLLRLEPTHGPTVEQVVLP